VTERSLRSRLFSKGAIAVELNGAPACRRCGKPMAFATWISMPCLTVYRCDPCKEQAWVPDAKLAPRAQQQQKKDGE
jgi:hypothetical protein